MILNQLQSKSREIRRDVIKMIYAAKSGHPAGSLSIVDVFTALYFGGQLNLDSENPWREDRDRVILSAGHICLAWYAALAEAGYFSVDELSTYAQLDSRLQAHPHFRSAPGIENTSGSLGQGMSFAVGVALAVKMKKASRVSNVSRVSKASDASDTYATSDTFLPRVICITSDAELQEGQAWEAAMAASKYQLTNLTFVTDRNRIQIDGTTEDIIPLEPLAEKIGSFGFYVLSIDGHNIQQILNALKFDLTVKRKPAWIIANTTAGKGVTFMENDFAWHSKAPSEEEMKRAMEELNLSFK